jgi:diguanylate cyclase (GGDEF)-like protein/PAS domain S-box-containing protein
VIPIIKKYRSILFTIAAGYLVVLIGLAYLGTQFNQSVIDLKTQTSELYIHPFQVNTAAYEARLAASRIRNDLLFAIADDSHIHTDIEGRLHEFDATLDRCLLTIEANFLGDKAEVRIARQLTQKWKLERAHLIELLTQGRSTEAEKFMLSNTALIYAALISKLDYIIDLSAQKARYFEEQAERKSVSSLNHFHTLLLVLALFIGITGLTTVLAVLAALRRRDQKLAVQQKRLRRFEEIIKSSDDAIISKTLGGIIESWNNGAEKIFGYSAQEAIGRSMTMLIPTNRINEELELLARIARGERIDHYETVRRCKDGRLINISATISPIINESGKVTGASKIARDITEHYQAELEQHIAAAAFETQEGMVVTDLHDVVMRVNRAFSKITGYAAEEAIGNKMNFLRSGRQSKNFYDAMWVQLRCTGEWQGEIWNRNKDGEIHPHWVTITSVKDNKGSITNHVGTYTDITERKQTEEIIKQLAYHDALTQLPNRRLLTDRLQQAMAASARSQHYGALMFLDLDNFKPLNDTYGHEAGDLLLIEATHRLISCVREMDTVARFGGDEFVIMISELGTDKADSTVQTESIAEKIRTTLSAPYCLTIKHNNEVITVQHHCTASIGITLFIGNEATQDDLLKWADDAMYQAKEDGRNLIRFHAGKT